MLRSPRHACKRCAERACPALASAGAAPARTGLRWLLQQTTSRGKSPLGVPGGAARQAMPAHALVRSTPCATPAPHARPRSFFHTADRGGCCMSELALQPVHLIHFGYYMPDPGKSPLTTVRLQSKGALWCGMCVSVVRWAGGAGGSGGLGRG